jgi:tetratricopeptide (TPR) repeat protein
MRCAALRETLSCLVLALTVVVTSAAHAQVGLEIPDSDLQVTFTGLIFNRKTNTYDTSATLTNTSTTSFSGEFSLVLPTITPTSATLANATCHTADAKPVVVASFPPGALAPGAKLSNLVLKFSNPAAVRFTFTHTVLAGNACTADVQLHAFSDSRTLPDAADVSLLLQLLSPLYCQITSPVPLSYGVAMASIQTKLNQLAGAGALEGFIAGNASTHQEQLVALAAAAMADNKGPGALAALLAAHHNDPTNPAHLVNAAGAASLLAMPNEAIALLDAADAMGGNFGAPMGIDGHAIAQNNRGFALHQLGQWSQAQALFSSATALEPSLSEARLNLSYALLCQGDPNATEAYLAGLRRSPLQALDQTFDLSRGIGPDMPQLPYPATAGQLRSRANLIGEISQGTLDKINSLLTQRDQVLEQLTQAQTANPPPTLTTTRSADIFQQGDMLGTPAFDEQSPRGLSDLWAVEQVNAQAAFDLSTQLFDQYMVWEDRRFTELESCVLTLPYCSAAYQQVLLQGRVEVRQGLSQALLVQGRFDRSVRAFADPWYHALTGLAANLSDPLSHQYRSLQAQVDALVLYRNLAATGGNTFGHLAFWWEQTEATNEPGGPLAVVPNPGSSLACPDSLKAAKFQVAVLGAIDVSFNCETVEASIAVPGLGPFAELSYPRSGDWTVFMGIAGGVPGTTIGAKIGFGLKGNDGGFTDALLKTSQSVGVGPVQIDSPFGLEMSIAGAMQCPLGCN